VIVPEMACGKARKVLNVIDGAGWSGGVEQAFLLARGLAARGIETGIACHAENGTLLHEGPAAGVPTWPFEGGSRWNPGNYARLRALAADGFDVLIAHKPKSVVYALAVRAVQPSVRHVIAVRRLARPISRLSSWTKYRMPDRVVAVCDFVADRLRAAGVPEGKIVRIPSGIDLSRFHPRPELRADQRRRWGVERDDVTVLIQVANFLTSKGHRFLFEALAGIGDRLGDYRLVLAGRGTDGAECRDLVERHGLRGRVIGLGMRRDVERLLCGADLFVFPSLPGLEAIGGAVLQAMASGVPVIVSAWVGPPEYIEDARNGFLVDPGDAIALREAISAFASLEPASRRDIAARAVETVRAGYSIERTVDAYVELIDGLSADGAAGRRTHPS
jgi:glycosyltransferase involved in cell wall biosynthesis